MAFDVFISHSSSDKQAADAACAALESSGIRCWIAPRDARAGREYGEEIVNAIGACRVMVLIFSANANASRQVSREIERAVNKGLTIIPLRIENVVPTKSMEYFLDSIHWLDALTPPLASHLERLVDQVQANLHVDPAAAPRSGGTNWDTRVRPAVAVAASARRKRTLMAGAAAALLLVGIGVAILAYRSMSPGAGSPAIDPSAGLDGTYVGTYTTTQLAVPRQVFMKLSQSGATIAGTFEANSLVYGSASGTMTSRIEGEFDDVRLRSPKCNGSYTGKLLISGGTIGINLTGESCVGKEAVHAVIFRSPVAQDVYEAFRRRREGYDLMGQNKFDDALVAFKDSTAMLKRVVAKDPSNAMWETDLKESAGDITTLAVNLLVAGKFQQALDIDELAISMAPDAVGLNIIKAHALMFLGRPDEARALYLKYADRRNVIGDRSWKQVVVASFSELRAKGLTSPLMDEIEKGFAASP